MAKRTDAPSIIRGVVHIQAEANTSPGDNTAFRGVAYRGGVLFVGSFRDGVVVDLAGLTIPETLPIASDHRSDLAARVGTATATIEDGQLIVNGSMIPGSPAADRAIALARGGGLSLSIGAIPTRIERVARGSDVKVNGRTFPGPIEVAREADLVEVSAVGVGADRGAVALAAQKRKDRLMDENDTDTIPQDDPTLTERTRITEINAAFRGIDSPQASRERERLIEDGSDLAEARGVALTLLRASRPTVSGVRVAGSATAPADALVASAAQLLGASAEAIEAAKLPLPIAGGPSSLLDVARESLRVEGREVPGDAARVVRAAFSTDSFSGTLAQALSVVGLQGFASVAEPAMQIAHKIPLPNFKASTIARLNGSFVFSPLGPGGELKSATIAGETTPIVLETKGAIVQLTRKAVIDDDRQLLAGVPHELGREAARSIGDTVNTALDDVAGVFFTTARNNLMSGPSSALSVDSLTLAIVAMRTQRDDSGRVVNMAPKYLMVGADLEATARSIINSTDLGVVDGSPRGNPMQKAAEVLVDARIAAGQWYLVSESQNAAIVLATLGGKVQPTVESVTPAPDQLGMGWRAWLDYGIALHEWRGVVKSLGA